MDSGTDVLDVVDELRSRGVGRPEALIVLGSGLGGIEREVGAPISVPFHDLAGMPTSTVPGHAGRFMFGRLGGVPVLVQSGRFHAYEGHDAQVLGLPVRVASELGARLLVTTNAAGGIRGDLEPGDLVLLEDHVNFMFRSPLVGRVQPGEDRFPDMSEPYDRRLAAVALRVAEEMRIPVARGVYGAVLGPAFETAAEVRMLALLGVDVVGMSTVPEVLVARARGMRCLAFSMVTNRATGLSESPVSHADVLEVGARAGQRLARLLVGVLGAVAREAGGSGSDGLQSGEAK
jgi:purine-nucleoside phosphorylase